ncbi:hypothetical protein ACO0RG_000222 [Hanseniaspora osmophila]
MSLFTTTTNVALSEAQFFAHSQQQQQQQEQHEQEQEQEQEQESFDFNNFMLNNDSESELDSAKTSNSFENVNPASFIADWLKEDDPIFTFEEDETMATLKYEKDQLQQQKDEEVKENAVSHEQDNYWNCLFDDIEKPMMDTIADSSFVKQEKNEEEEQTDLLNLNNTTVSFGFLPTPVLEEDEKLSVKETKSKPITAQKIATTSSKPNAKANKVTKTKKSTSPFTPASNSASTSPKLDELGIVSYTTKKRSMPLNEIKMDDLQDPAELKRAKNTEAARRSRARKFQRMQQLEDKVAELLEINANLVQEIERLKNGNI